MPSQGQRRGAQAEPLERGVAYVGAILIALFMAYLSLARAAHPVDALALTLVTLAALLATPQLLDRLLAMRQIRTLVGFVVAVSMVVVLIALVVGVGFGVGSPRVVTRVLVAAVVTAFYAGLLYLAPRFVQWAVGSDGFVALAEWLERDNRVFVIAGAAFLAGTGMQFVAAL